MRYLPGSGLFRRPVSVPATALASGKRYQDRYCHPQGRRSHFARNLVIPKDAPHVEEAYAFIDFLLRPETAARNTNFTHLANGVLASKSAIDKNISGNESIYPDAASCKRLFAPQA